MKKELLIIFGFVFSTFAAGGDTLKYDANVEALANGDRFYADIHWHPALDSIQAVVNSRLGDINLSASANISQTKIDSVSNAATEWISPYTRDWQQRSGQLRNLRSKGGFNFFFNDTAGATAPMNFIHDTTDTILRIAAGGIKTDSIHTRTLVATGGIIGAVGVLDTTVAIMSVDTGAMDINGVYQKVNLDTLTVKYLTNGNLMNMFLPGWYLDFTFSPGFSASTIRLFLNKQALSDFTIMPQTYFVANCDVESGNTRGFCSLSKETDSTIIMQAGSTIVSGSSVEFTGKVFIPYNNITCYK